MQSIWYMYSEASLHFILLKIFDCVKKTWVEKKTSKIAGLFNEFNYV